MSKVYLGDVGTEVEIDCVVSLSGASFPTIEVFKPDGTRSSVTATLEGATKVSAIMPAFDQTGPWRVQPKVQLSGGTWRGETAQIVVYDEFD